MSSFRPSFARVLIAASVVVIALLFSGCGTTWRVEYDNPQYGNAAVQFALPKKGGYAK